MTGITRHATECVQDLRQKGIQKYLVYATRLRHALDHRLAAQGQIRPPQFQYFLRFDYESLAFYGLHLARPQLRRLRRLSDSGKKAELVFDHILVNTIHGVIPLIKIRTSIKLVTPPFGKA